MEVSLEGKKLQALIDSGSGPNLITKAALPKNLLASIQPLSTATSLDGAFEGGTADAVGLVRCSPHLLVSIVQAKDPTLKRWMDRKQPFSFLVVESMYNDCILGIRCMEGEGWPRELFNLCVGEGWAIADTEIVTMPTVAKLDADVLVLKDFVRPASVVISGGAAMPRALQVGAVAGPELNSLRVISEEEEELSRGSLVYMAQWPDQGNLEKPVSDDDIEKLCGTCHPAVRPKAVALIKELRAAGIFSSVPNPAPSKQLPEILLKLREEVEGILPDKSGERRPVPQSLKQAVEDQIQDMLARGWCEKLTTPEQVQQAWILPFVIVRKEDGSIRLCMDSREVNKLLLSQESTLPTAGDILAPMQGAQVFSKSDMRSAFFQLRLHQSARRFFAFRSPIPDANGNYVYYQMRGAVMGAKPVTCDFSTTVASIFNPVMQQTPGSGFANYVDDFFKHSRLSKAHAAQCLDEDQRTQLLHEQHLAYLSKFFGVALEYDLKFSIKKLQLFVTEVEVLGRVTDGVAIWASPARTEGLRQFTKDSVLGSKDALARFIHVANFWREFIPQFTQQCIPLRPLMDISARERRARWGEEHDKAFKHILDALIIGTNIYHYDEALDTEIHTDASLYAYGAVLVQRLPSGKLQPIAWISKGFSSTQCDYSVGLKELYGALQACRVWYNHIITARKPVLICSDHANNVARKRFEEMDNAMARRWRLELSFLPIEWRHRSGLSLVVADCLSRNEVFSPLNDKARQLRVNATRLARGAVSLDKQQLIREEHLEQPFLIRVAHAQAKASQEERATWGKLVTLAINEDVAVARAEGKLVVPKGSLRAELMDTAHSAAGCQRTSACLKLIHDAGYSWKGIEGDLDKHLLMCLECQLAADPPCLRAPLTLSDIPKLFEHAMLDYLDVDQHSLLVIIDVYSGWIEAEVLPSGVAVTAERSLDIFIKRWEHSVGLPRRVSTDGGTHFKGAFRSYLKSMGVEVITSSPLHSQSMGQVENKNKRLINLLRKMHLGTASHEQMVMAVSRACYLANTTPCSSREISAYELRHLIKPTTSFGVFTGLVEASEEAKRCAEAAEAMRELVAAKLAVARLKQKQYYDQRATTTNVQVGQFCRLWFPTKVSKLESHYQGIYRVKKVLDSTHVEVARWSASLHSGEREEKEVRVHVNRLHILYITEVQARAAANTLSGEGIIQSVQQHNIKPDNSVEFLVQWYGRLLEDCVWIPVAQVRTGNTITNPVLLEYLNRPEVAEQLTLAGQVKVSFIKKQRSTNAEGGSSGGP